MNGTQLHDNTLVQTQAIFLGGGGGGRGLLDVLYGTCNWFTRLIQLIWSWGYGVAYLKCIA